MGSRPASKAVAMSGKIFNTFLSKNIRNPKNFHLYPPNRLLDKNPVFTKNGDSGKSFTYTGEMYKDHKIFEAIGATEELNAYIGLAREYVKEDEKLKPVAEKLLKIQLVLVDIVDIVSSLHSNESGVDNTKPPIPPSEAKITNRDVANLESLIVHYGTFLPPAEKVIIPGGGKASAALHVAQTMCRRCERTLVSVFKEIKSADMILAYINRLNCYLSQAARISAKFANTTETVYKPRKKEEFATIDK